MQLRHAEHSLFRRFTLDYARLFCMSMLWLCMRGILPQQERRCEGCLAQYAVAQVQIRKVPSLLVGVYVAAAIDVRGPAVQRVVHKHMIHARALAQVVLR